jgi:dimethylargininase
VAKTKYALVCAPSPAITAGLRIADTGDPNYQKAQVQHRAYCDALQRMGYTLIVLPPDRRYPDSVFTEDPAVIMHDVLVKARLRDPARAGEEAALMRALGPYFPEAKRYAIEAPGYLEGGDVIFTGQRLFVGITKRTNMQGARQLGAIAQEEFGTPLSLIPLPDHVLHLKSIASFVEAADGRRVILAEAPFAPQFEQAGYTVVPTPGKLRFDANVVFDAGTRQAIVHLPRVRTAAALQELGIRVTQITLTEFEKIDGAASCLSKLFSA